MPSLNWTALKFALLWLVLVPRFDTALAQNITVDFGAPLATNYTSSLDAGVTAANSCSLGTAPGGVIWTGSRLKSDGSVTTYGVVRCSGGAVTVCGSDVPANSSLHLLPAPNAQCAVGDLATASIEPRYVLLNGGGRANVSAGWATVASASSASSVRSIGLSWADVGWSFWSASVFACGADITRTQPADGSVALGGGVEVLLAPTATPNCIVATADLVAAIAVHYNLSCSENTYCSVNQPDLTTAVRLSFGVFSNATDGFAVTLSVRGDGTVCLMYRRSGASTVGPQMMMSPWMLADVVLDRRRQALHFNGVVVSSAAVDGGANGGCVNAVVCTASQVYVPQENTCLDFACSKVWFKVFNADTLTCENRPFVLGIVLLLLVLIIVGEIANFLLSKRLRNSLARLSENAVT